MPENPRIEELRRRVQADPASIAFAALAEEFRRTGRFDEAIETCRTGLQRHPAYLSARVTLGRALIEVGDYEGARAELRTVLESAPENLAALRGLEQIDERLGHSTEMHPDLHVMAQEAKDAKDARDTKAALEAKPDLSFLSAAQPPPLTFETGTIAFEAPAFAPASQTASAGKPGTAPASQTASVREPGIAPGLQDASARELGIAPGLQDASARELGIAPASQTASAGKPAIAPASQTPSARELGIAPASHTASAREPGIAPGLQDASARESGIAPASQIASAREPGIALGLQDASARELGIAPALQDASAGIPDFSIALPGLDPHIAATLVRLERFLGAIQSARQA